MDARDGMALSGPASYYIHHRGLPGSGPGGSPGVHGPPPGMRSLPNPNSTMPLQSPNMAGGGSVSSSFQVESPSPLSQQQQQQQQGVNPGNSSHGGSGGGGMSQGETVKRKRGRPRKYGPDGTVSLTISPPTPSSTPMATSVSGLGSGSVPGLGSGSGSVSGLGSGSVSGSGSAPPSQKRGRGRPPGTGRKQQLASFGEWLSSSAGMGFTPHVLTIAVGEDIASKIMAFSQQGPRAVCILSANGAVSTVTLRQPASGGTVTYEGRFEILSLSGSYSLTDSDGSRVRSGGLSITLSSPDGRVIGGGVGGALTAATPVQVVVGSFIYAGSKTKKKSKTGVESGGEPDVPMGGGDNQMSPSSTPPGQNLSPVLSGWPGSRDMRNSHLEIDLTRG